MRTALLALGLLVASTGARAGEDANSPDGEIARRHFHRATELYDQKDYAAALTEFEAARRVAPLPELDYNIARCHDRLEHLREAIAAYRRYVESKPASDATDVVERIRVLEERLAADAPPPPPIVPPPAPPIAPVPPPSRGYLAPVVLLVAAAATAIVGAVLVASVAGPYDAMLTSCPHSCSPDAVAGLEHRADAGYALWGVAAIAAAVDVVLWAIAARRPSVERRVQWPPSLRGAALGVRF